MLWRARIFPRNEAMNLLLTFLRLGRAVVEPSSPLWVPLAGRPRPLESFLVPGTRTGIWSCDTDTLHRIQENDHGQPRRQRLEARNNIYCLLVIGNNDGRGPRPGDLFGPHVVEPSPRPATSCSSHFSPALRRVAMTCSVIARSFPVDMHCHSFAVNCSIIRCISAPPPWPPPALTHCTSPPVLRGQS